MLFTVIVPVYNVEKYIHTSVDSILSQSFRDFEVILVDDGSTDNCPAICDEYAKSDQRVHVFHKPNGGQVSARNIGISHARGEYILYVDADDWVSPDWMSTIEDCISRAPAMPDVVAFGHENVFSDHSRTCVPSLPAGFYNREQLEKQVFPYLLIDRRQDYGDGVIFHSLWNKAYKRELLEEHHCMDEGIRLMEDGAFIYECCICAQNLMVCDKVLYYYNRENSASVSNRIDYERFKKLLRTLQYIQRRLSAYTPLIEGQMNDYYASRLIVVLIKMNRVIPNPISAARHIAKELKATHLLDFVHIKGLPFHAGALILALKLHFYLTVCLVVQIYIRTWYKWTRL